MSGGPIRIRVYIAQELKAEDWVAAEDEADPTSERHISLCLQAGERGDPWFVEVWIPSRPTGRSYLWFGTDSDGMRQAKAASRLLPSVN